MNTSLSTLPFFCKRILITGGMGFWGWNAARHLRSSGISPILTSSQPERYPADTSIQAVFADVLDEASLRACFEEASPHAVIHAAALSAPMACEQNPALAHLVNVKGTKNVLSCAQEHDIPIIFLSTDLVFSGNKNVLEEGFYTETDIPDARIVYGQTKREAERLFENQPFAKWIILRSALMYGRGAAWTNAFPQFAVNLLKSGKEATLFYDQFRTPAYVPDISDAILTLLETNQYGRTFHCGGGERIDRVSFVERYCALAGIDTKGILSRSMDDIPNYTTRVQDVSLSNATLIQTIIKSGRTWHARPFEAAFKDMLEDDNSPVS